MPLRLDPEGLCVPGDWGVRPCRSCNPAGLSDERPLNTRPNCPGCDGSGWTDWPAMATEPWSEIIPGLWIGGHDYVIPVGNLRPNDQSCPGVTQRNSDVGHRVVSLGPKSRFDVVISAYHRSGFEPDPPTEYHKVIFPDSCLDKGVIEMASQASEIIAEGVQSGKRVLSRCQAGLNRSALIAGLAMVRLGFSGTDAVQLIRARRSPWALCNEDYARFLGDCRRGDLALDPCWNTRERVKG